MHVNWSRFLEIHKTSVYVGGTLWWLLLDLYRVLMASCWGLKTAEHKMAHSHFSICYVCIFFWYVFLYNTPFNRLFYNIHACSQSATECDQTEDVYKRLKLSLLCFLKMLHLCGDFICIFFCLEWFWCEMLASLHLPNTRAYYQSSELHRSVYKTLVIPLLQYNQCHTDSQMKFWCEVFASSSCSYRSDQQAALTTINSAVLGSVVSLYHHHQTLHQSQFSKYCFLYCSFYT